MDLGLKNKVFIVTGSSRGIGFSIAKMLLDEGARVVINGRVKKPLLDSYYDLKKLNQDNVDYFKGDISKTSTIHQLKNFTLKKWSSIDGIVANAGQLIELSDKINFEVDELAWFMKNNFYLSHSLINEFTNELQKSSGSIVIIGSIAGCDSLGAPVPYSVAKSSLKMYTKSMADILAKDKIRLNLVSPGNILFDGGNWERKLRENKEEVEKYIKTHVPLNKFGVPEDIANMVSFLLSNRSNFITGSNFVIDGGQTRSN